jgi:hypothetical protein
MNTLTTVLLSGIVPLVIGFLWYSPKTFAPAWMKAAEVSEEKLKSGRMVVIFGVTYLLGCLIALFMITVVIHQSHVFSIFQNDASARDANSELGKYLSDFISKYGQNFRTFKHGAFHGIISALLYVMPVIAINALFERRGFKYIAIHTVYWIVTLALIGGLMCQFAMKS